MTATAFGLNRIGQIAVNARDIDRATRFYRDTLGMRLLFQVPKMSFFDCGGIRMMLSLPEEPRFDHAGSILYYQVADIAAAHTTLVQRGVHFEQPPHVVAKLEKADLWLAFFKDSEDNFLALMAEVPRA